MYVILSTKDVHVRNAHRYNIRLGFGERAEQKKRKKCKNRENNNNTRGLRGKCGDLCILYSELSEERIYGQFVSLYFLLSFFFFAFLSACTRIFYRQSLAPVAVYRILSSRRIARI